MKLGTRKHVFLIFVSRIKKKQAYICPSEVGREGCREVKGGTEWRDRERSPLRFHCRIFMSKDSYTRLVRMQGWFSMHTHLSRNGTNPFEVQGLFFKCQMTNHLNLLGFFFHLGTEAFTSTEFFPWIQKVLIIIGMQQ